MKKSIPLLMILCVHSYNLLAQSPTAKISGTVTDATQKAIEAATVQLLKSGDRSLVKVAITDKKGVYEIDKVAEGKYLISITAIGYQNKLSADVTVSSNNFTQVPALILDKKSNSLSAITVTGKKPMVENKIDKTVVNVESFISNAGGTAMDVLEKSPGVTVDRDGNIGLKGKQGVIILVDGKQTFLGGQDLANFLKNMPSNQLETIEIMTQPSAKYDASGNSGIINITTKKNKQSGFNGSVSLSYVQGVYPKSSNSITFNYRKNKVNFFSNYSYSYFEGFNELSLLRKFRGNAGNLNAMFDQQNNAVSNGQGYSLRTGIDYSVNKKTTIGFAVNGMYNPRHWNSMSFSKISNGSNQLDSTNTAHTRSNDPWKNKGLNLNFRKVLDTTGRELTADFDYLSYLSRSRQFSDNYTFTNQGQQLSDSFLLRGNLPSDIKIYSAKADYVHPLSKESKIEAGLKSSYVETDNNAQYNRFDNPKQQWVTDDIRSNHFIYTENINAAYINYNRQIKKWGVQSGLRYEHTISKGRQLINSKDFNRNYGQLFPTAYLSYALNKKNQFGLSYGRRIERPNYRDMNPFQYFLDQYTYQEGNPYLTPQFSHNIQLSHNFKSELNTTLNYTQTTDIINDILKQNNATKVTYVTKENVAKRRNIGLSVNYNKPLAKWWTTSVFANIFNNRFEGFVNNTPLDVNISSLMLNVNNHLKFKKGWGGELSGFYRSRMQDGGIIVSKPMGVFSLGASKQIINRNRTLKLKLRDPFYIQQINGFTRFGDLDVTINNKWDNRRVGLSFNYRFGKPQNNGTAKRKTGGAQDEQNRVGGGQQ